MLFNKPLAEIEENDLQELIDTAVRESKDLDYKESLSVELPSEKKEFLSDVSSFANAIGGYLIYGVKENKEDSGLPVELCGLQLDNPGKFGTTLENIIQTGIDPRLPASGVHVQVVLLPSKQRWTVVIHIQQSWLRPHMVKPSGRFFTRSSSGKYALEVSELRTAFELSGRTAELIRDFRAERLGRIAVGEETPVPLNEQAPKLVLHMIPFNAFSIPVSVDIRPLYDGIKGELFNPLIAWDLRPDVDMRFNVDGIMRSVNWGDSPSTAAYTQVFRNGIIETVDMSIIGINAWNVDKFGTKVEKKSFSGELYEKKLLQTVERYIDLQKFLGIDPPFFIMVSFFGVKGYKIWHPKFAYNISPFTREIDRINLIIPEAMLDNFG
ncbi:MAG TPA: ATP-binding protein, partial [Methylomirabilota bacterium]|nr:ATP-binding protein [Methylomirabilota bacterium]